MSSDSEFVVGGGCCRLASVRHLLYIISLIEQKLGFLHGLPLIKGGEGFLFFLASPPWLLIEFKTWSSLPNISQSYIASLIKQSMLIELAKFSIQVKNQINSVPRIFSEPIGSLPLQGAAHQICSLKEGILPIDQPLLFDWPAQRSVNNQSTFFVNSHGGATYQSFSSSLLIILLPCVSFLLAH